MQKFSTTVLLIGREYALNRAKNKRTLLILLLRIWQHTTRVAIRDCHKNDTRKASFPFHEKDEFLIVFALTDEVIACLPRERLKIADRARISRDDAENFAAHHFREGLLGLQDRQGTIQAASIELFMEFHGHDSGQR